MSDDLIVKGRVASYLGRKMPVSIGRAGIAFKQGEGDGITPIGTWRVEHWMVRTDRVVVVGTPILPSHVWIDEPSDPRYNQLTTGPVDVSCEQMHRDDPLYDIVGVLNFNRDPILTGKGSAIFIHQWRSAEDTTEGCVAFDRSDLIWLATNWRDTSRVIIQP